VTRMIRHTINLRSNERRLFRLYVYLTHETAGKSALTVIPAILHIGTQFCARLNPCRISVTEVWFAGVPVGIVHFHYVAVRGRVVQ
jgi:hypothetical protein